MSKKEEKKTKEQKELEEKYQDALEVLRQIDKLPTMKSYHLKQFKRKWKGEL